MASIAWNVLFESQLQQWRQGMCADGVFGHVGCLMAIDSALRSFRHLPQNVRPLERLRHLLSRVQVEPACDFCKLQAGLCLALSSFARELLTIELLSKCSINPIRRYESKRRFAQVVRRSSLATVLSGALQTDCLGQAFDDKGDQCSWQ